MEASLRRVSEVRTQRLPAYMSEMKYAVHRRANLRHFKGSAQYFLYRWLDFKLFIAVCVCCFPSVLAFLQFFSCRLEVEGFTFCPQNALIFGAFWGLGCDIVLLFKLLSTSRIAAIVFHSLFISMKIGLHRLYFASLRYRSWSLGQMADGTEVRLVCRTEQDGVTIGPNGDTQTLTIKAFNEWDSKVISSSAALLVLKKGTYLHLIVVQLVFSLFSSI